MAKTSDISYQEILRNVDARSFAPIYFLYGSEPYYIDLIAKYFEDNLLTEDEKEFNMTVMYGKDITAADIVNNARQYPSFADYRLTIVREAQQIDVDKWEAMSLYMQNPLPQSIIVICYKKEKFDGRIKAFKDISKSGVVFESKKLYDNQLPGWITSFATDRGLKIDIMIANLLAEYLGNDLSKISNEIAKLKTVMDSQKTDVITSSLIEKYIGISKDYNVFELIEAVSRKDVGKAMRIVNHMAANPKENSIAMITIVMFRFYVDLMIVKAARFPENRDNTRDIMSLIGAPYPKAKQLAAASQSVKYGGQILSIIGELRTLDARFKGIGAGNMSDYDMLRETIYKIIHT